MTFTVLALTLALVSTHVSDARGHVKWDCIHVLRRAISQSKHSQPTQVTLINEVAATYPSKVYVRLIQTWKQ